MTENHLALPDELVGGYRGTPDGGPVLRSDVVDVYLFKKAPSPAGLDSVAFLQLLRSDAPLAGTWQPVMGHVRAGETAPVCAIRELEEETGLAWGDAAMLGMWALEQVHPYYVAAIDAIMFSPRFAVEVSPDWSPTLSPAHTDARWIDASETWRRFMWPGQVAACAEVASSLARPGALCCEALRITDRDLVTRPGSADAPEHAPTRRARTNGATPHAAPTNGRPGGHDAAPRRR
ncbi:MAG TPA: NUDIX domain-containing protein [Phycisphaerales bacterium]|nr:NUDIX domain-containing protein [Phycisphaerales bacterium]